jgi:hypothetical protein
MMQIALGRRACSESKSLISGQEQTAIPRDNLQPVVELISISCGLITDGSRRMYFFSSAHSYEIAYSTRGTGEEIKMGKLELTNYFV